PLTPSSHVNTMRPPLPAARMLLGPLPVAPGLMSLTRNVVTAEPFVDHSSEPVVPSLAEKNTRGPATLKFPGELEAVPGRMSRTRTVFAAVPSLENSSVPTDASVAENSRMPPSDTRLLGELETLPGL